MMQQKTPEDYVISTGEQYSVRDFVNIAANFLDMKLNWEGEGINEKAFDNDNNLIVSVNKIYFRPNEVENLLGDSSKARKQLGWKPKIKFLDLVKEMVDYDYNKVKKSLIGVLIEVISKFIVGYFKFFLVSAYCFCMIPVYVKFLD